MAADIVLDTRGLRCPLPVLRLETTLRRVAPGTVIRILADDPVATLDIPVAAQDGKHAWVRLSPPDGEDYCVFEVTRATLDGKEA